MEKLPYKAVKDLLELHDIVTLHGFNDIKDVLTSDFIETRAEIIREDYVEGFIDVNYKSISVTIIADKDLMAKIRPSSVEYYDERIEN